MSPVLRVENLQIPYKANPHFSGKSDESQASSTYNATTSNLSEKKTHNRERYDRELVKLEDALPHKVIYIIGKEQMRITKGTNYVRMALLQIFLWISE
jgi:KUP system potassium uptake protein